MWHSGRGAGSSTRGPVRCFFCQRGGQLCSPLLDALLDAACITIIERLLHRGLWLTTCRTRRIDLTSIKPLLFTYALIAMHQGPPCIPFTYNYGKDLHDHDNHSEGFYWTVVIGRITGIYLDKDQANAQTHKCMNQKMKKFSTHAEAVAFWDEWCLKLHDHGAPRYQVKGISQTFESYDEALAAAADQYIKAL
ncbi:hypothetical protein DFH09DRAFT_589083 [Mycena vulgaris]|nr:hypothetical protein DFH09DRAFT_589083 [Mycena vulgaris]